MIACDAVAGVDLGTTMSKALLRTADGERLALVETRTPWTTTPDGGTELDAERFVELTVELLRRAYLAFGDFDADGRTDVVGRNAGYLMVSWGGASQWEVLNFPQAVGINPPVSSLAVGNFDGVGGDDLFCADGATWYVSYGGSAVFVPSQTSSFRTEALRFGDFDANGTTDVFGVVSDQWSVSDGAIGSWRPLRSRLTDTVDGLYVADFDGDGHVDVATTCERGCWKISNHGTEAWNVVQHQYGLNDVTVAGIGHFLGHSSDDVVMFNYQKRIDPDVSTRVLFIAEAGVGPFRRLSRQEMT